MSVIWDPTWFQCVCKTCTVLQKLYLIGFFLSFLKIFPAQVIEILPILHVQYLSISVDFLRLVDCLLRPAVKLDVKLCCYVAGAGQPVLPALPPPARRTSGVFVAHLGGWCPLVPGITHATPDCWALCPVSSAHWHCFTTHCQVSQSVKIYIHL